MDSSGGGRRDNPGGSGQGTPTTAGGGRGTGTHTEREDHPWVISIPDHPRRTDSAVFVAARSFAHRIMETLGDDLPYGKGPWQMHHGASLWTYDDSGWFLVLNTLGSEWAAQWCADPAKMDLVRRNAVRHYAGFPRTLTQMAAMGYPEGERILNTPITDADSIGVYVDSIFNSCVPLAGPVHTGVVSVHGQFGGIHHYPKPITDIQFFKHDDFILWVTDEEGQQAAVTPVGARGSGDGRVQVVYSTPGTKLDGAHRQTESQREQLVLPPDHPLAKQAFRLQY